MVHWSKGGGVNFLLKEHIERSNHIYEIINKYIYFVTRNLDE